MGRKVVGNLTTVTGSLDNFIVAMLCCEFANAGAAASVQDRYLRFEQLAAYLRLLARDINDGLLGVTRARVNLERGKLRLGSDIEAQLLADQAGYGLWGLYSSALESVGLIDGERRRPTASGKQLVEQMITQLGKRNWETLATMAAEDRLDRARVAGMAAPFEAMLRHGELRRLTVEALLARQKDCLLQSELFGLAQRYLDEGPAIDIPDFCAFVLAPGSAGAGMRDTMTRIRDLDPVLKRADMIMNWLQGKADTRMDELAAKLAPFLDEVAPDAAWRDVADLPHLPFLDTFHAACVCGDAGTAIRAVLAQNRDVMALRGGASWLDTDASQRLVVRVRNDRSVDLAQLAPTAGPWRHTYFIGSFLAIASQGRA